MNLELLQGTDLYIPDSNQSAKAVWGFIPWRGDGSETVDLSNTWNTASGYYVFFPAEDRGSNWSTFVSDLSKQMDDGTNKRFGFFDAEGKQLNYLSVSGTGNQQALTQGSTFEFRNIQLKVSKTSSQVNVTFDDATSTFVIAKKAADSTETTTWIVAPGGATACNIEPLGDLLIPVSGPAPGTLSTKLSLSLDDQAAFETGPMYFGPNSNGNGGQLTALRYPNFIASGSTETIAVTTYSDPAQPVDPVRTYFELTDDKLKTTFSSTLGRQVILAPLDGSSDADGISSRFVLSDRPVSNVGDNAAYYLTPYGSFEVDMTGTAATGEMICGYSATETFTFARGDVLRFVPGYAAYRANVKANTSNGSDPVYLSNDATTSWLRLISTDVQNTYYSQPQGSPIYEDNGATGGGTDDVYKAYKLAFKQIPAWPALGSEIADQSTPTPTPFVPMVPYGGVPTTDSKIVAQYQAMETKGINPQRLFSLKSENEHKSFAPLIKKSLAQATGTLKENMTPLGLVGGFNENDQWMNTKFALSGKQKEKVLQFEDMQDELRSALYQNQIFLVIDQNNVVTDPDTSATKNLFTFTETDATVELADWFFDLQLQGENPDGVPPILMLKFFRDKSIKELVDDQSLWEDANTFSSDPSERQTQLKKIIEDAEAAVEADPNSVYANFVETVNDPAFTGLVAVNTALKLEELPAVIKALLGGMVKDDGSSNIAAFRAHHVGVKISDTGNSSTVSLDSSSVFALVDYEDSSTTNKVLTNRTRKQSERELPEIYAEDLTGVDYYGFKVIYVRALFENNALTSFAAEVDLTVNNLFAVGVNLGNTGGDAEENGDGDENIIKIMGSYSEHDGAQTYSFIAEKTYEFAFDGGTKEDNPYLKKITFDKVQFSATEETEESNGDNLAESGVASQITSRFAIWGSMEFYKLDFLDMFSFEKLSFADLGIEMSYLLKTFSGGKDPETSDLALKFSPGNLRFDFGETKERTDDDSMLALLPFKLKSFLYSEKGQAISELDYFGVSLGSFGVSTEPTFNFALIFDFDLGSLGGLVSSLSAFKFSVILGWQPPTGSNPNALVFGVQMPEADGKLELNIEGVLKISIEEFQLKYTKDTADKLLVLELHNSYMEILGTRMPPGNIFFNFALFAPTKGENKIGWIVAFENKPEDESAVSMKGPLQAVQKLTGKDKGSDFRKKQQLALSDSYDAPVPQRSLAKKGEKENGGENGGGSKLFKLDYIGVGQRVGPDENLDNFDDFLAYMKDDFWKAFQSGDYDKVYKPDGGWIVVASFELLEIIGLGFVFYDSTPFYSLKIYITNAALKGLSFEITYTKVSDDVGLFFINFTLPDTLRTFQVGAASLTLPALKVSIYTNSDFKIDLGFPANDDWTVCFRVEAFVGPVPVTGSGGFYIAKLSSATDNTFQNNYDTILAAGFGARIGVGKDFTAGPLKAGVSLTFFGIIEGAIGYYARESGEDVVKWLTEPKALSIKGQFGVIGELYGSLDFVIIKASVNVRIQASVGIQLLIEDGRGGDILLYVEASVSVSVKASINLGLFKISVSFSFKASFRFEWKLIDSGSSDALALHAMKLELASSTTTWNPDFALQSGLNKGLSTMMTPELTTVWSDTTTVGDPWFVVSLTMEYVNDPSGISAPSGFDSFETLAAQMVSWSLNASSGLTSWSDNITQEQIDELNKYPETWINDLSYSTLIEGLGKMFALSVNSVTPDDGSKADEDKDTKYATIFPMPPFLGLKTTGRGSDLNYVFGDKSKVSEQWVTSELQTYFEQLYTNITDGNNDDALMTEADTTVPLIQTLFLDWFQALARSTINALLTQMQNDDTETGKLEDVFLAAVKSGQIKNVAGQMSQFFRSGLRLPETTGMEIPVGSLAATNPLYSLIWQEFPVDFGSTKEYEIDLFSNQSQPWVTVDASWKLLDKDVSPYQLKGTDISIPGNVKPIPFIQTGPQAYALTNPITWTPTGGSATTLRPFTGAMSDALKASAPLAVNVLSRKTDKAYDIDTTTVPSADLKWSLSVEMVVRKVPAGGGQYLANTYALGSSDLTVQNLMRNLLTALGSNVNLVKSIDLLYQESSDTSGLISSPSPKELFVLRTNTTTQSIPPPDMTALALDEEPQTQVGADTSDPFGFLQILEQSSVTNQTGYFMTYEDAEGKSLPNDLFGQQTFAPVTFLFEIDVTNSSDVYSLESYLNAVVLNNADDNLLYYAETTNVADETTYVAAASGSAGVELSRTEPGESTVADRLSQLYSQVAYQVPASTGFIASNLSVPVGPQKEDETDTTQNWRLAVPLYNLATDNQGKENLNRYASIGDTYSIETLVVDAFGNAFGSAQTSVSDQSNLYFDDLVTMGNWTGIRSVFNFQSWSSPSDNTVCSSINAGDISLAEGEAKPDQLSVYLCPSKASLPDPANDIQSAAATAELYQTIIDQLKAPAVKMFVNTNLDSTKSDIILSSEQTQSVLAMLESVKSYLQTGTGDLVGSTLTVTVPGTSADLSLVFQLQVDFGIKRTDHISPEVANYANATRVTTNIAPPSTTDNLSGLAADFRTAFPAFTLATGPADGTDVSVGDPITAMAEEDDEKSSAGQPKGLWAVSKKITELKMSSTVRQYLAPKPLDTKLRSGVVTMPNNLNALSSLPKERTFSDINLDDFARSAFAAIDSALGAENASNTFQLSPENYKAIAYAREDIADRYADNEVKWLLNDATYQGDGSDLCQGQDLMAQQMRAALGSAYAVNTIVQTKVEFSDSLPANMGNRLQLFGQMQRPSESNDDEGNAGGFGLGTARVDIPSGDGGQTATTSFLYGVTDQKIEETRYEEFPLEWNVSHLQVFLEDREIDYCEHGEAAPPSLWLQFIDAFETPPTMGDTIIPLAYREYPTPPTMVVQTATRDTESTAETLADMTRWIYTSTYQARLLAADEITLNLIYNTGGTGTPDAMLVSADAEESYTLFDALCRFHAGYEILQPQMSPITENTPADVITAFSTLVTQLANNKDWLPTNKAMLAGGGPIFTLEQDVVTDRQINESSGEREIILKPDPMVTSSNPWIGDKCVIALDPSTMKPYTDETESCSTTGEKIVTHDYIPDPPLTGNFVTHQVKVKGLTTLLYENGNSGIGTRRNANIYPVDTVFSNPYFIYQTPIVAATNPLTPFVDNPTPIVINKTVVTEEGLDLGDYVRRTLEAMMGLAQTDADFLTLVKETTALTNRRLKIDARYGFPIGSPSGSNQEANYFVPLAPAVLVRSFDLPVDNLTNAITEWVGLSGDTGSNGTKPYSAVLADWLQGVGLPLGQPSSPDAPPEGAMVVFDVTLYSQLTSGTNQLPLLRLSDMRLDLSVVAAPVPPEA